MALKIGFLFILLVNISFDQTLAAEPPCGDWEPYKDEFCFKIFPNNEYAFADAERMCHQNYGYLAVIHYAEEQEFLNHFIFKKNQIVNSVWIGAQSDASHKYRWKDGSDLIFTNWAKDFPKNQPNYCVEMHSDVDSVGKWADYPCKKNNTFVCQKHQTLPRDVIEAIVIELKHNLQQLQGDLAVVKTKLTSVEKESKNNAVPIGFIYIQLPKEKSPSEIWPAMKWSDVSKDYAGVFFRVEGGQAATFGQIQEANSTGISNIHVQNFGFDVGTNKSTSIATGQWSQRIFTGTYNPSEPVEYQHAWKLYVTGGENRPKNMAIRVWKRSS